MPIRPMPSPTGTNRERLFVLRGHANPHAAFDAASQSLESAHGSETVETIMRWALANMTPAERLALSERLQSDADATPAAQDEDEGDYEPLETRPGGVNAASAPPGNGNWGPGGGVNREQNWAGNAAASDRGKWRGAHDAAGLRSDFSLPSGDRLRAMFAQGLAIAAAQRDRGRMPATAHDAAGPSRFNPQEYGRAAARRFLSEQRGPRSGTPSGGGDFYKLYPEALRVGVDDNMGVQPRTRSAVASALGARSFAEMFPGAERIGSV